MAFCLLEGIINPLKMSLVINPIAFINFSRVGLSPTQSLSVGVVAAHGTLDRAGRGTWRVDRVRSRSTGDDQRTCWN